MSPTAPLTAVLASILTTVNTITITDARREPITHKVTLAPSVAKTITRN